jgi:hypothetical protein
MRKTKKKAESIKTFVFFHTEGLQIASSAASWQVDGWNLKKSD